MTSVPPDAIAALQIHRGRLELFLHEVSRREPLYFRQRGIEESDEQLQDPVKYKERYYMSKLGQCYHKSHHTI
jgi:hypothetical protein